MEQSAVHDSVTGSRQHVFRGLTVADALEPIRGRILRGAYQSLGLWQLAVHDVRTGAIGRRLTGHVSTIRSVSFSPDGSHAVTAGEEPTARVWDLDTGSSIVLRGHTDRINSAVFSPDGGLVATSSNDATVRVWHAATGRSHVTLRHATPMSAAYFSPDGRTLVAFEKSKWVQYLWPVHPAAVARHHAPRELTLEERTRFDLLRPEDIAVKDLVDRLFAEHGMPGPVVDALRDAAGLTDATRKAAIRAAFTRGGDESIAELGALFYAVRRPGLAPATYQRAATLGADINREIPLDGTFLTFLGIALYRCERYEDALAALHEAGRLGHADDIDLLAFSSLCHLRSGDRKRAAECLARAQRLRGPEPPDRTRSGQPDPLAEARAALQAESEKR